MGHFALGRFALGQFAPGLFCASLMGCFAHIFIQAHLIEVRYVLVYKVSRGIGGGGVLLVIALA